MIKFNKNELDTLAVEEIGSIKVDWSTGHYGQYPLTHLASQIVTISSQYIVT